METKIFKGMCRISGKEYPCEVIDGVRYINGMTVAEFLATLDIDTIIDLAILGQGAIDFDISDIPYPEQQVLDSLEQKDQSKIS